MAGKQHAVSQLEHHYSRFQGALQVIEKEIVAAGMSGLALRERRQAEIDGHRAMLGHIEACVRLFEPSWTSDHIKPIKPRRAHDRDKWGELLKMAFDVLRPALQPMSSVEILASLWKAGRINASERDDYGARLTTLMRGQEKVGAVRSDGRRPFRWSIIRAPGQS